MTVLVDDDFGTDTSANYTGATRTVSGGVLTPTEDGIIRHNTTISGTSIWVRLTFGNTPAGLSCFACSDSSGNGELFVFDLSAGNLICSWVSEYDTYTTYAGDDDDPAIALGTYVGGDQIGITIDLSTNVVRFWNGVTANEPTDLSTWDGAAADDSIDIDTLATHALGNYVGVGSWSTGTPTDTYTRLAFGDFIFDPVITLVNPSLFLDGQTGIVISGATFEASQGTGSVRISPTDNVNDAGAVTQTVTAWGATSITFTAVRLTLGQGTLYLFVTNNSADSNASGYPVRFVGTAPLAWIRA